MDFLDIQIGSDAMIVNASENAPVHDLTTFLRQEGGIESTEQYAGICG